MTSSGAEIVHVLVAAGLAYAIGFERDLRGTGAGDRTFGLIGIGAALSVYWRRTVRLTR